MDDLASASAIYERLLGVECYKVEEVPSEQVRTAFFRTGETKVELLEAMSDESAIARFISKRGPGMHHIAFAVDDIYKAMYDMRQEGFILINEEPTRGADNKLVCFIHPKSTGGVLIELCQDMAGNVHKA